jgi:hypothetical protein
MTDEIPIDMQARIDRYLALIDTVHERVACPKCGSVAGKRCVNMSRSYKRGRENKRTHPERVLADGLSLR